MYLHFVDFLEAGLLLAYWKGQAFGVVYVNTTH